MKKIFTSVTCFLFLTFCFSDTLRAEGNSKADIEDLEKRFQWAHEFPGRVIRAETLPGTHLIVTTLPSSKKEKSKTLWLMDGKDGKILWTGPEPNTQIVAGDPYPLVVIQAGDQLEITAKDRSGQDAWSEKQKSVSLSIAMDETNNILFLLTAANPWYQSESKQPVSLRALSAESGKTLWTLDLGPAELPAVIPSNILKTTETDVWALVGSDFVRISRDPPAIGFRSPFKMEKPKKGMAVLRWDIDERGAAFAYNNQLSYLDKEKGLAWSQAVDVKNSIVDQLALEGDSVVTSFLQIDKELPWFSVLTFNRNDGSERWRYEGRDANFAKFDRTIRPPEGLVVAHDKVAFAFQSKIQWLDIKTGKPVKTVKVKKDEYTHMEKLTTHNDLLFVMGKFAVRAFDLKSGEPVWHEEDLATPEGREIVSRRIGGALMAGAMAFRSSLAESQAQSMKDLANTKWVGRQRIGPAHYSDYVFSPSQRGQMLAAAQGMDRSDAWFKVAESMSNIDAGQKFIDRVCDDFQNDLFVRPKLKGKNSAFSSLAVTNLALVNIRTGEYSVVPMPKVGIGCVSAMISDLTGNRLYHGYHRGGLGCQKSTYRLEAYRYQ